MVALWAYVVTAAVIVGAVLVALPVLLRRRQPAFRPAPAEPHEGYVEPANGAYRWRCSCESWGYRDNQEAAEDALALHRRRRLAVTS